MALKDVVSADTSILLDTADFAEAAVYTPKSGAPVAVSVIVSYGKDLDDAGLPARVQADATILVSAAVVADPQVYDSIQAGGVTWTVRRVVSGDGFTWELACDRDLMPTMKR